MAERKMQMPADFSKSQERKVARVMREFKKGKLKSSAGTKVRSRKQAVAIALSEARRLK